MGFGSLDEGVLKPESKAKACLFTLLGSVDIAFQVQNNLSYKMYFVFDAISDLSNLYLDREA